MGILFTVIASGSALTDAVDLSHCHLCTVFVPGIDSADLLVQANFDPRSAGFARVQNAPPAGDDVRFPTATGSKVLLWPGEPPLLPFLKLETSAPQADTRTFTLLTSRL